jgi:hypothetical protein
MMHSAEKIMAAARGAFPLKKNIKERSRKNSKERKGKDSSVVIVGLRRDGQV